MENLKYPIADWKYEVANGDTVLGYAEWVEHKRAADDDDPTPEEIADEMTRRKACILFGEEGKIEIDENAKVSRADGNPDHGAYVQAWVWVPDED